MKESNYFQIATAVLALHITSCCTKVEPSSELVNLASRAVTLMLDNPTKIREHRVSSKKIWREEWHPYKIGEVSYCRTFWGATKARADVWYRVSREYYDKRDGLVSTKLRKATLATIRK